MRTRTLTLLLTSLLVLPATAQKRSGQPKEPSFADSVVAAQKAFEAKEYGTAITALQAAIKAVQKLQRAAILEALPKPAGYEVRDEEPADAANNPFGASLAAFGQTITRHCEKEDKRFDIEVMANSPLVGMLAVQFSSPQMIKASGGELVEYGAHKAILKNDDGNLELMILLNEKHVVKVESRGHSEDELFAVFDQACVDRIEKQLGK